MATLLSDNFNRADNASVIGAPQTGPSPVVQTGVGGISGNQMYAPTGPMVATYDLGTADVEISFLAVNINGIIASVVLGYVGGTDYYYVSFVGNNAVSLVRVTTGGSVTLYASSVKPPTINSSVCKAHYKDGIVRAYVDGVLVFRWLLDAPITSHLHGVRQSTNQVRIDNLLGTDAPVISEPDLTGGLQTNALTFSDGAAFISPAFGYRGRDTKIQDTATGA